ncbi:unknown [Bacteroides fragilis CAG:47]|nr:unknown [Bacteroides fragilis CAG:47]
MRIVVVWLVFGLNEAVLLVLAATAELPITHEVELPPCFTYTPVHPLMVLLVKPVTLMLIVSLHNFWLKLTGRLWLRLFTFVISPESKVMKSLLMSRIDTVLLL